MQKRDIIIKTVDLKNNCPECFTKEGLQLTFKQAYKENGQMILNVVTTTK